MSASRGVNQGVHPGGASMPVKTLPSPLRYAMQSVLMCRNWPMRLIVLSNVGGVE